MLCDLRSPNSRPISPPTWGPPGTRGGSRGLVVCSSAGFDRDRLEARHRRMAGSGWRVSRRRVGSGHDMGGKVAKKLGGEESTAGVQHDGRCLVSDEHLRQPPLCRAPSRIDRGCLVEARAIKIRKTGAKVTDFSRCPALKYLKTLWQNAPSVHKADNSDSLFSFLERVDSPGHYPLSDTLGQGEERTNQ
jgi:hypothetical protein